MATQTLNAQKVLDWIAENPAALRIASAEAAVAVLGGPEITSALAALDAAAAVSQDSNPATLTTARDGVMGAKEVLQGLIAAINTARFRATARVEHLSPSPAQTEAD